MDLQVEVVEEVEVVATQERVKAEAFLVRALDMASPVKDEAEVFQLKVEGVASQEKEGGVV